MTLFYARMLEFSRLVFVAAVLSFATSASTKNVASANTVPQDDSAESLSGNYLAGLVAGLSKDTAVAAFYYAEALKEDPKSGELIERTFVTLLAEGQMTDALKLAERIAKQEPGNEIARLALGVRGIKTRQYAQARTYLNKGGRGRAADLTATLLSAWTLVGSKEFRRAMETIDRLKGEETFSVFRNLHGGLIANISGRHEISDVMLSQAYATGSNTLRVTDLYGRYLAQRGNRDQAKKVYADFKKLMPRHPLVLDQIKALEEGKALEPPVDTAASGAAEVLYSLGAAGNGEGDELASLIYLRLSLWLDPTNAMAIMMLGEVYERMGQLGSANEVYDLVPINSSFRYNSELQVALNLEQLGRSEDSVKQLNSLISHARGLDAYSALGNVYRSRKEFEAAGKAYSDAIALIGQADSSHWSLFYARGISYERTKQWPKAEADFRKALELWPDQPLVLNYLGYSWIDQGINLEEGFKMLKRAVELRPKDGYIVDSVGWAYYRLGKYEESLEYMEKAVSLKPSDPVINDHLGDVYWRLGRKLEAGFQWNHARDLKPEPEDLQKILDKIEKGLPDDTTSASGG